MTRHLAVLIGKGSAKEPKVWLRKVIEVSRFVAWGVVALALGSASAGAASIVYVTPNNASVPAGAVNAEADITTSNGSITITLKDLLSDPKDAGQLLSDFSFTVDNGGSLAGSTLTGATAQQLTVNGDGTFSLGSTLTTPGTVGWVYSFSSSTGTLDVLAAGGAGPSNLIIGPPGGATYADANGSIAGNGPHNPFLNQSATFTLTAPGVTTSTTITSATFSFGTTSGVNVPGVAVPEPAAVIQAATAALFGLGFGWRRWRMRAA